MQIVPTFKGRLVVIEVWNRLKRSNTGREKLFFSHELIMTSAELKAEQILYFPFCNFAEVHTLALGMVQLLWQLKWVQGWLMHSHGVSCAAFPPHHFPKNHGNVNNYFLLFKHCKWVSLCLLFLTGHVVQQINMKEMMQGHFCRLAQLSLSELGQNDCVWKEEKEWQRSCSHSASCSAVCAHIMTVL